MAGVSPDKAARTAKSQWQRILNAALEADTWGQMEEAVPEYEKLARLIEQHLHELALTPEDRLTLARVRQAVLERLEQLQDVAGTKGISREQTKQLVKVLEGLFERPLVSFPVALASPPEIKEVVEVAELKEEPEPTYYAPPVAAAPPPETKAEEKKVEGGSLRPMPRLARGQTAISIFIDKIGLKDAPKYIQPFLTVSVSDRHQRVLETQDTPQSTRTGPQFITLQNTVHLQTALEDISTIGAAIFFEFKHFKPKKKKISTRCFAMMEHDEVIKAVSTPSVGFSLELYQKPTDRSRKSLNLFTVKKLYLHVGLIFTPQ